MKKIFFLLLILFASCTGIKHVAQKSPLDSSGCENLKVISFNIWNKNLSSENSAYRWDRRKKGVKNMLKKENPSFFGLQEANIEQLQYLEKYFPHYNRFGLSRDSSEEKGEFMAIFYLKDKFELIDSGMFWLSQMPEKTSKGWDAAYNRMVTWVKLQEKITKKEFYYFNTHLDHVGKIARKESVLLILRKIKEIASSDETIILGGDFNFLPTDENLNSIKDFMSDARICSPITDQKETFSALSPSKLFILDYIFCRNVTCLSFAVLDKHYGVPYLSDHYPISFIFQLK